MLKDKISRFLFPHKYPEKHYVFGGSFLMHFWKDAHPYESHPHQDGFVIHNEETKENFVLKKISSVSLLREYLES